MEHSTFVDWCRVQIFPFGVEQNSSSHESWVKWRAHYRGLSARESCSVFKSSKWRDNTSLPRDKPPYYGYIITLHGRNTFRCKAKKKVWKHNAFDFIDFITFTHRALCAVEVFFGSFSVYNKHTVWRHFLNFSFGPSKCNQPCIYYVCTHCPRNFVYLSIQFCLRNLNKKRWYNKYVEMACKHAARFVGGIPDGLHAHATRTFGRTTPSGAAGHTHNAVQTENIM